MESCLVSLGFLGSASVKKDLVHLRDKNIESLSFLFFL